MEPFSFVTTKPLLHGGTTYPALSEIEIDDHARARQLLDDGAIAGGDLAAYELDKQPGLQYVLITDYHGIRSCVTTTSSDAVSLDLLREATEDIQVDPEKETQVAPKRKREIT